MSENKRFKVISDNFGEYSVLRHDDSLVVSEIPRKAMAELFCDELNELNNEIKQLKQELFETSKEL